MGYKYTDIKRFIEDNNCKLLTEEQEYENTQTKLNIECECGNKFITTFSRFKNRNKRQCNECGIKNSIRKQSKKIDFNCDNCGKKSQQQPWQYNASDKHFCCKECHLEYQKRENVRCICDSCGKEFTKIRSLYNENGYNYCCHECEVSGRHLHQGGEKHPRWKGGEINTTCDICGKHIKVKRCVYLSKQKHFYCSKKCCDLGKSKYKEDINVIRISKKQYVCECCGNTFYEFPNKMFNRKFKTCSRECLNIVCRGEKHPLYIGRIKVNCSYCNKEIDIYERDYKLRDNHYCNKECASKHHGELFSGEKHPRWNFDLTENERLIGRKVEGYNKWRNDVFDRDCYTCVVSGKCGGKLNVHHLYSYDTYEEFRMELWNGVTLSEDIHKEFHSKYGYGNNTLEQFEEFYKIKTGKEFIINRELLP